MSGFVGQHQQHRQLYLLLGCHIFLLVVEKMRTTYGREMCEVNETFFLRLAYII
jgi:hypothetical protein